MPERVAILATDPALSTALQQAIAAIAPERAVVCLAPGEPVPNEALLLPLTSDLPAALAFPGQEIFAACRDPRGLRERLHRDLGIPLADTSAASYWLPVALTARGPLYGEAIAPDGSGYLQPADLGDRLRQPLYRLGFRVLGYLDATPAVYLLEFALHETSIGFRRLWPFPAAPALASIGVQTPDLFACHWLCATGQPLLDLDIAGAARYARVGTAS